MIIAIPLAGGVLSEHFGHCEEFAFIEADEQKKTIIKETRQQPPEHEPGVLPRWLLSNKANVAIVGGMGMRARQMLEAQGVKVIMGAPAKAPVDLAREYLAGTLVGGDNTCGHGPDHVCDGNHDHGHQHKHPHIVVKK
ncbi:MAG TPA: NifB/NifX family molybdenum-iron cluster-binding protein [Candidatus Ozemobacteraceae bacterium]|nr:NifB/NifX family molybdenum-iron cluster-binding protein [Candidatus Ozemobacteraceae bacterium]